MKRFFKWYWEHVKSAYSFGGYPHPLSIRGCGRAFWQAEWRTMKSLFIVALLPQAFLIALLFLYIGFYLLFVQIGAI